MEMAQASMSGICTRLAKILKIKNVQRKALKSIKTKPSLLSKYKRPLLFALSYVPGLLIQRDGFLGHLGAQIDLELHQRNHRSVGGAVETLLKAHDGAARAVDQATGSGDVL